MNAADPVITLPVEEILGRLGPNGEHWLKGYWSDGDRMCLHQGIRVCLPRSGDPYLVELVAVRQGWGPDFNDEEATEFPQVVEAVRAHREITEVELAATFGPSWRLVRVVVDQAATLTADQADRLSADRLSAAYSSAGAARAAARLSAAGAAAANAALAVAVRDLIGQHGFTQADYDVLTGPWGAVFPGFDQEAAGQ